MILVQQLAPDVGGFHDDHILCPIPEPFFQALSQSIVSIESKNTKYLHPSNSPPALPSTKFQNPHPEVPNPNQPQSIQNQNHKSLKTMHLHRTITTIATLVAAASASSIAQTAVWNDHLQVWTIGPVASTLGDWYWYRNGAAQAGRCNNVPEGDYACGSFEERTVDAMRAIYRCKDGWLELAETCHEGDRHAKDRCVKNGRKKGKKFYPLVSGNKVFCQKASKVEKA